jgi:hypothetical protein
MINSILNRKPRKIVLDRLHYLDKNTNKILFTTDQFEIENEMIKHFKYLGKTQDEPKKTYNYINDLPTEWQSYYDSINTLRFEELTNIGEEINITELDTIIKDLPNDKASGPSKIVYEDFKLSRPKY